MTILKSFASAFLMYSRIPMPAVEWKEENRRYALCFFPCIGAIIGGVLIVWCCLCRRFSIPPMVFSAVSVCIPVIITGGIHIDGYMDVHDAKACMGDKEKKLQVMKDSRVGAFAVIRLCLYFILQFACFYEMYQLKYMFVVAGTFIISRALSGLAAVNFKSAVGKGSLTNFTNPAHRTITTVVEIVDIAAMSVVMLSLSFYLGLGAMAGAVLTFIYYRYTSYKEFGGITGDLAGYFLQICELAQLMMIVAMKIVI